MNSTKFKSEQVTKNNTFSIRLTVISALMAALCCVGTMIIRIPSPTDGYVNLGDCFVLLSGFMLPGFYGVIAAGVGSALADLLAGYAYYIPGTFVIKALVALVCALSFKLLKKCFAKQKNSLLVNSLLSVLSGILAEAVMVLGYFVYESVLLGYGLAAAAGIFGNIMQGVAGVVTSTVLVLVFNKYSLTDKLMKR